MTEGRSFSWQAKRPGLLLEHRTEAGWRIRAELPTAGRPSSTRSTEVIDGVHEGHISTSMRMFQMRWGLASIPTVTSKSMP
jgi:hypothetical protein